MTVCELLKVVLDKHPAPWVLTDDGEVVRDAKGECVISDGTCFLAFYPAEVGLLIVALVNAHAGVNTEAES